MTNIFSSDVSVAGNLSVSGNFNGLKRSKMDLEAGQEFDIPLTDFRVHNALATVLPATSAADDLGIYGTFGTSGIVLKTYDVASAGSTNLYARAQVRIPRDYIAGQPVSFVIHAGMEAVASVSCNLDLAAYKSDEDGTVSSDLVTTAAQDMNSTTFADYSFSLDASSLVPGDLLDFRIDVNPNSSSGSGVVAVVGSAALVCSTRG